MNDRNLSFGFGFGRNSGIGKVSVSAETHLSFGRNLRSKIFLQKWLFSSNLGENQKILVLFKIFPSETSIFLSRCHHWFLGRKHSPKSVIIAKVAIKINLLTYEFRFRPKFRPGFGFGIGFGRNSKLRFRSFTNFNF